MYKRKSVVKIYVVLFKQWKRLCLSKKKKKQWKRLFIQHNQTAVLDSVIMVWIISVEFSLQAHSQGVSKSKPRLVT